MSAQRIFNVPIKNGTNKKMCIRLLYIESCLQIGGIKIYYNFWSIMRNESKIKKEGKSWWKRNSSNIENKRHEKWRINNFTQMIAADFSERTLNTLDSVCSVFCVMCYVRLLLLVCRCASLPVFLSFLLPHSCYPTTFRYLLFVTFFIFLFSFDGPLYFCFRLPINLWKVVRSIYF